MTNSTQSITKSEAFAQIEKGIINAGLPAAVDFERQEQKENLTKGLTDVRAGIERIRSSEKLFKDDQWLFDWLSILSSRVDTFEQAMELEEI